jgi:hypothetical protein
MIGQSARAYTPSKSWRAQSVLGTLEPQIAASASPLHLPGIYTVVVVVSVPVENVLVVVVVVVGVLVVVAKTEHK